MNLNLSEISPVPAGEYPVRLLSVKPGKCYPTTSGLRRRVVFKLQILTGDMPIITCGFFHSKYPESPYGKFVLATRENFSISDDVKQFDTDNLLDMELTAKISLYINKNGDEIPSLDWLAPADKEWRKQISEDDCPTTETVPDNPVNNLSRADLTQPCENINQEVTEK